MTIRIGIEMSLNENYQKLLSTKRIRESSYNKRDLITEAESDRARLIFCPAFRRLQQKAQVFSMEPNAAVRSRLTHSLEVSQMGRYIAELIVNRLTKDKDNAVGEYYCRALVKFVENACLMHDIGNPPFGHFGEAAISKWFEDNGVRVLKKACNVSNATGIKSVLFDFYNFDGNPQGLRVVSKLQRNNDEFGLNLTYTTLASYLKYVRGSDPKGRLDGLFKRKCGYFDTEAFLVEEIWKHFGYNQRQRFPFAYIMEAADDLAYCISDLEDSIEKELLVQRDAIQKIQQEWRKMYAAEFEKPSNAMVIDIDNYMRWVIDGKNDEGNDFSYIDFRTNVNRDIAEYAADQYIQNHEAILVGKLPSLISESSVYGKFLELLKDFCRKNVYSHESVQRVELAGYRAIFGLLDHFECLLTCDYERFQKALNYENKKDHKNKPIIIEKKLLKLFPKNYIKVYEDDFKKLNKSDEGFRSLEWNIRAHLIVDFISGMTDDYSMDIYRELSGMKL